MKLKLVVWALISMISLGVYAQDEEGFTDEELKKYASVMVWAEMEKSRMADSVEYWVKNNDDLSASVYNKLSKASKAGNIADAEATEQEIAVFQGIQAKIENQKKEFKTVYVDKIKADIGAGLYNKLNKALKSDEEVKSRYDEVFNTMMEETKGSGDMDKEEKGESEG